MKHTNNNNHKPTQCLIIKYCTVPYIYILNKYYTVPIVFYSIFTQLTHTSTILYLSININ